MQEDARAKTMHKGRLHSVFNILTNLTWYAWFTRSQL